MDPSGKIGQLRLGAKDNVAENEPINWEKVLEHECQKAAKRFARWRLMEHRQFTAVLEEFGSSTAEATSPEPEKKATATARLPLREKVAKEADSSAKSCLDYHSSRA